VEATQEGGGVVDVKYAKNKYSFVCQLFDKQNTTKPIVDNDGIITDNYAIRLTPENPNTKGFLMEKTAVSIVDTWTAADGGLWEYTFEGLEPLTGDILKPYPVPTND
jgi:hypothetical protein